MEIVTNVDNWRENDSIIGAHGKVNTTALSIYLATRINIPRADKWNKVSGSRMQRFL